MVCKYIPGVTAKEIAGHFNLIIDRCTARPFNEDELLATPTLTASTRCVMDKETCYMKYLVIIYKPKRVRWGIVAHESLHVLTLLNDWLGIEPPKADNDEPHAYFIGWLADCVGSLIDRRPERMKGKLLEFDTAQQPK